MKARFRFATFKSSMDSVKIVTALLMNASALDLATAAPANCPADLSESRRLAVAASISIPTTPVRVGDAIRVSFQAQTDRNSELPLYIVTTSPSETRYRGSGFAAFTQGAKAPLGIAYGSDKSRTVGPVFRNPTARLDILPQIAGRIEVTAAIVYAGDCGEHVLRQERVAITVSSGTIKVVAQDRFAEDRSIATVRSPNGRHYIKKFATRFEVYDERSNDLLLARVGLEPNFSPTGRFLAAQATNSAAVEIFDLYSSMEKLPFVTQADQLLLVWANNDSFLVAVGNRWSNVSVYNIVSDEKALVESGGGCHACDAWADRRVFIDLNAGFTAVLPSLESVPTETDVGDLYRRWASRKVQPNEVTGYFSRTYFGGGQVDFPSRWDINSPLKLSHYFNRPFNKADIPDDQKREEANRPYYSTMRFLVSPPKSKAAPAAHESRRADEWRSGWLTAQVRSGRDLAPAFERVTSRRSTSADANLVVDRLGQIGLRLGPSLQASLVYQRSGYTSDPGVRRAVNAVVAPIRAKMKQNNLEKLLMEDDCKEDLIDLLEAAHRIFKWSDGGSTFWLLNTQCVQGSGAFMYGNTYLFTESGSRIGMSNLNTQIRSAGGGWTEAAAQIRLFRLSDDAIGIAAPLINQVRMLNPKHPDGNSLDLELIDASLVVDMRMTEDRRHIIQINSDGRFFVTRLSNKTRVLSGAYADDEVVVATEVGYYDSTFEGAQLVNVRFDGIQGLHRFSQFESVLYRPGLAKQVLAETFDGRKPDLSSPPRLTFRLQKDTQVSARLLATADFIAEQPVKELRLFVEGRLTKTIAVTPDRTGISFDLNNPGAGRWVTAVAVDGIGQISQPVALKLPGNGQPGGSLHGVYIGIDNYGDPKITRLQQAKHDAENLANTIKNLKGRLYAPATPELLLDEAATRSNILARIKSAAEKTTENDRLLVFFAGHGVRGDVLQDARSALYLTAHDTALVDLKGTAVAWDDVSEALSAARGTVIVIIDACHSGFAERQNVFSNDNAATALLGKKTDARVILAASKGRQESEESSARGGEFTNALVSILSSRGRDTPTDLIDIYGSLKSAVVKSTSGRQTPWLVRNGLVGNMNLF